MVKLTMIYAIAIIVSDSVSLLYICSPKVLDVKVHKFIHLFNPSNPNSLNLDNLLQFHFYIGDVYIFFDPCRKIL